MARLSSEEYFRDVRARHPILDVLHRLGVAANGTPTATGDVTVSCPLPAHEDRTPSCVVHPATGRFHCFGCGTGGDVVDLVREVQGARSAADAIAWLDGFASSNRVGPAPSVAEPDGILASTDRARIVEINRLAWEVVTETRPAAIAREYLRSRGIDLAALEAEHERHFAGYTPAARDGLVLELTRAGCSKVELVDSGWAVSKDDRLIDRFHRRVVLPIHDQAGDLLAVVGRDITGTAARRYLNTPTTTAYRKSDCLYLPVRSDRSQVLVLCEGPIDALAIVAGQLQCVGGGVACSASPSGTALTSNQARRIQKFAPRRAIICSDSDPAGREAGMRWLDQLRDFGLAPERIELPTGHDPASWLAAGQRLPIEIPDSVPRSGLSL